MAVWFGWYPTVVLVSLLERPATDLRGLAVIVAINGLWALIFQFVT